MALHVIGLVSGGKDSLYSLAHCIVQGHRVVALANLHPTGTTDNDRENCAEEADDLNSFMYQTVGHSIIPLYADALELPLYRREIRGTAAQKGRYYDTSGDDGTEDETEDLIPLLKQVIKNHPEANALCSGAILSTYQRTRVESVAIRLGLTPISPLWQYPALPAPVGRGDSLTGLLDDMHSAGCDARIIKIASGGIKESLIWANVADERTRARLLSGMSPFFNGKEFWLRGAVLGEGGEYETLALNGPANLWKRRIDMNSSETRSGEGGSSYAILGGSPSVADNDASVNNIPAPQLLDSRFAAIENLCTSEYTSELLMDQERSLPYEMIPAGILAPCAQLVAASVVSMTNIISEHVASWSSQIRTAPQQMTDIVQALPEMLVTLSEQAGLAIDITPADIVHVTLLLRSMCDFATINPVYAGIWPQGLPNPPARVTVAAPLPTGVDISMSVLIDLGKRQHRRGLHVQSRSYWAPANIGPYSQAISTPLNLQAIDHEKDAHDLHNLEVVHVAGQIPLVPSTMEMLGSRFSGQSNLALQHLWRLGQERGIDLWQYGVAYLPRDRELSAVRALTAAKLWRLAHELDEKGRARRRKEESDRDFEFDVKDDEEEAIDVWHLHHNRGFQAATITVGEHLYNLPNYAVLTTHNGTSSDRLYIPPFVAAEVSSLPRDAPVEWWSSGLAGLASHNRAASTQPFSISINSTGILSGLVVEYSQPNPEYNQDDKLETSHEQVKASIFATILLRCELDSSLNLVTLLREHICISVAAKRLSDPATAWTIATSFAFLRIPARTEIPEGFYHNITAHAAVIPCYRVWGIAFEASSDRRGVENDELVELSAALVLRIDIRDQQG